MWGELLGTALLSLEMVLEVGRGLGGSPYSARRNEMPSLGLLRTPPQLPPTLTFWKLQLSSLRRLQRAEFAEHILWPGQSLGAEKTLPCGWNADKQEVH